MKDGWVRLLDVADASPVEPPSRLFAEMAQTNGDEDGARHARMLPPKKMIAPAGCLHSFCHGDQASWPGALHWKRFLGVFSGLLPGRNLYLGWLSRLRIGEQPRRRPQRFFRR